MQIHIVTIFPDSIEAYINSSIIKRARANQITDIQLHNLRKWADNKHNSVDDKPYGGGPGMVMMVEPFYKAVKEIRSNINSQKVQVIMTSAKGTLFNQKKAAEYTSLDGLIILCGHYEGIDQRVADFLADEEISIGNYVLTGGELPALVIADAVVRLLPGVLGNADSLKEESHNDELGSEYPHYTRPAVFTTDEGETWSVPDILLTGNHKQIDEWREKSKN